MILLAQSKRVVAVSFMAAGLVMAGWSTGTLRARTSSATDTIKSPAGADTASHDWTTEQLLTSSVHEAWVLSGRNEDKFFAMVQTLATMSAQKRGLTLPESQEAGMRAGAWIKKEAK